MSSNYLSLLALKCHADDESMTCIVCHNKQSLKKRFPFKILDKTEETYPSSEKIFIETKNETFSGLKAERKDMSR